MDKKDERPKIQSGELAFVHDWTITRRELEEGDFPSLQNVALALRGERPVPKLVREFFAQLIEDDRIRLPKHRPKKDDWMQRRAEDIFLLANYHCHLERIHEDKKNGEHFDNSPSIIAMECVVEDLRDQGQHVSFDWVKKKLEKIVKAERERGTPLK